MINLLVIMIEGVIDFKGCVVIAEACQGDREI